MPLHASSDSRGLARGESEEPWTALPPSRPTRLRVLVRARRVSDEQPWLLQDRRSVRSSGGGGHTQSSPHCEPRPRSPAAARFMLPTVENLETLWLVPLGLLIVAAIGLGIPRARR